jgi:hypothetical protein
MSFYGYNLANFQGVIMKKQRSYEIAYKIAVENLIKLNFVDILDKIKYSGCNIIDCRENRIEFEIKLFNDIYSITYPDFTFNSKTSKVVSLATKIIILHYLENSGPFLKPTGELVSYKHIPGAFNYYPVFQKKSILPLLEKYRTIQDLKTICEKIEGTKMEMGDFAFKIKVFPKIDIVVIFWEGDEEFSSTLDFLFDSSIKDMLSLEDIVVLAQMLSKRMLFV